MGTNSSSNLCEGVLYDSGGESGRYQANENYEFTVCPDVPHECLSVNVETFRIENPTDHLFIFAGQNTNGVLLADLSGNGTNPQYEAPSGCLTFQFTSDGTLQDDGFKLSWKCESTPCTNPPFSTCSDPYLISNLPFEVTNFTTCGAGNSVQSSPCFSDYLENEEYIFVYDSPGNECLELRASNMDFDTGLGVYADCPNVAAECLAYENSFLLTFTFDAFIPVVKLDAPGRYYFVVGNPDDCTNFDLSIKRIDCPIVFPTATRCEDALPITGCNINVPSSISVALGTSEVFFIRNGVNNGCWAGVPFPNFSWFYFQAQADGEFGFIIESEVETDQSDYDINVWGPLNGPNEFCAHSRNNQPIRSTYADDDENGYELTGLIETNPFTNQTILDDCEDDLGDGFVRRISVKEGEYYLILVNDYDGIIFSGGILIDFSNTTPGVLGSPEDIFSVSDDVVICDGDDAQLQATGGLLYNWINPDNLNCSNCPNPIATPSETTTYQVEIRGICAIDTMEVTVFVNEFSMQNNLSGCAGEDIDLNIGIQSGNISWMASDGVLSCNNCLEPTITLPNDDANVIVTFEATVNNCTFIETIIIEVLPDGAVMIVPEIVEACEGDLVTLSTVVNQPGGEFLWSNGAQTAEIEFTATIDETISVNYQPDNDCDEGTASAEIRISSGFSIEKIIITDGINTLVGDTLYEGCNIQISALLAPDDLPNLSYLWLINGDTTSNQKMINHLVGEEQKLTIDLLVTFEENCTQFMSISKTVAPIEDVLIPNIFSPNGDSQNQYFKPIFSQKAKLVDMKIFNRWGQVVYNNDTNTAGWSGRFGQDQQPVGVYIYQISIEMPNGQIRNWAGDVTLMR